MPVDVLQHHDCIVHHEADGNRQGHQRQVVERIAHRIHQSGGPQQSQRHGHAGNDGRPHVAQEQEDHHDDQEDRQAERELDVLDRRIDGRRAIDDRLELDGRRHRLHGLRQQLIDLLDGVDDVGAGLFEDLQHDARMPVLPGLHQHVLGSVDRHANVADAHRGAVLVGDDDIVPGCRFQQLVIVVNRKAVFDTVDRALRGVDRGRRDDVGNVLQLNTQRRNSRRIHLHTNRGFLLATQRNLGDTGDA